MFLKQARQLGTSIQRGTISEHMHNYEQKCINVRATHCVMREVKGSERTGGVNSDDEKLPWDDATL